jgi:hypothetical protein
MSLYANLEDRYVKNVIICEEDQIDSLPGVYVLITEETGNAGINYLYDKDLNKFIAPQPYASWVLNENYEWESPVGPSPEGFHIWDEVSKTWNTPE